MANISAASRFQPSARDKNTPQSASPISLATSCWLLRRFGRAAIFDPIGEERKRLAQAWFSAGVRNGLCPTTIRRTSSVGLKALLNAWQTSAVPFLTSYFPTVIKVVGPEGRGEALKIERSTPGLA